MMFGEGNFQFKFGKKVGYLIAYVVFASALFLVLTITKRSLPLTYVVIITTSISITGLVVKRLLK